MLSLPLMRAASIALVVLAVTYTAVLCALFTLGAPITNGVVTVADAAIVLAIAVLACVANSRVAAPVFLALTVNFLVIAVLSGSVDLKSVRDALVIAAVLLLAMSAGSFAAMSTVVLCTAALVLAFGVLEALSPDTFGRIFDVVGFYVMRGTLDGQAAAFVENNLFVSSLRGEGRALLPFVPSAHRVSSIFLEPVSMGNYGALLVALGFALDRSRAKLAFVLTILGVAAILAADARFAAGAAVIFALARLAPLSMSRMILIGAPISALGFLLIMGATVTSTGDDLPSRLALSGRAIANLDGAALFGLAPGGRDTIDSGYTYAIRAFGFPLCVLAWAAFVWLPAPGEQSARMKLFLGLYISALLCVSGSSLFALKTAALAWYALGCLIAAERPLRFASPHLAPQAPAAAQRT